MMIMLKRFVSLESKIGIIIQELKVFGNINVWSMDIHYMYKQYVIIIPNVMRKMKNLIYHEYYH
eukprot:CAMPEP_0201568600 /NCGR_PEP_ID=MMETSP0190_2-20130828/9767_1 /ASSEMBLY_ACC=CAM_ASM_000263 /TAXON_ID=37353 /ORGANISM="Rosalina sp." /LENGTH=63 /DNA_ID=CAMNT_0047989891 /DNA_START=277 /DNA_END=468 /DNA_ORIENTATION=-